MPPEPPEPRQPESAPSSSAPPPGGGTWAGLRVPLGTGPGGGGLRKLVAKREDGSVTVRAAEIVIEHSQLRVPLEIAPGGVAVATIDRGPARVEKGRPVGRFPILHRLSPTAIIPREEGIEGWLWTSIGGSALTVVGDEDVAPNVALLFSQPLEQEVASRVFDHRYLEDLAKRSPLGSPTIFGVLLRVVDATLAETALTKVNLIRPLTDRDVPPVQRRHLPDDKPANPQVQGASIGGGPTSVPPPGIG